MIGGLISVLTKNEIRNLDDLRETVEIVKARCGRHLFIFLSRTETRLVEEGDFAER